MGMDATGCQISYRKERMAKTMLVLSRRVDEGISVFRGDELIAQLTLLAVHQKCKVVLVRVKARRDIGDINDIFSLLLVDIDQRRARLGLQAPSNIRFYRDEIVHPPKIAAPSPEWSVTFVTRELQPTPETLRS